MPRPDQPDKGEFNTDLVRYQLNEFTNKLSELKVITEQGFGRVEGRMSTLEGRLSGLEIWQARADTKIVAIETGMKDVNTQMEGRNTQGIGAIQKVALYALGILSALVAALSYLFQRHS